MTTDYVSFHPVWTSGRAAGQPFVIQGTVYYPEETIMYLFINFIRDNIEECRELDHHYFATIDKNVFVIWCQSLLSIYLTIIP